MSSQNPREQSTSDLSSQDIQETQWWIAKSVLDANRQSSQALEYLLLWTYNHDVSAKPEVLEESINQAIVEYEQVLEALELAKKGVATLNENIDSEPKGN